MNKQVKIVVVVAVLLCAVVVVFARLNRDYVAQRQAASDSQSFAISWKDATKLVSMDDILSLQPAPIEANYKKNGKSPVQKTYTGVSLKAVLDFAGADYSSCQSVGFTALDGYASALPIADALNEQSCFIAIAEDGVPLGDKATGGSGPFLMILAQDPFSQRWCKFLMEVVLS